MEKVTRVIHQIRWQTNEGYDLLDHHAFKTILANLVDKLGEKELNQVCRFDGDYWKGDRMTQRIYNCLYDENLINYHVDHNYGSVVFVTVKDETKIRKLLNQLD